jgi:ribonuclease HII
MPSQKSLANSRAAKTPQQLDLGLWQPMGLVAGVDEAGRGPLAGPVVAAAVILDDQHTIAGVNDSKKLTPKRREQLFEEIRAKALCFCIAEASTQEIDELNILQATLLAMRRAVEGLRLRPSQVLVDGNRLPILNVPAQAIVKGDSKVASLVCGCGCHVSPVWFCYPQRLSNRRAFACIGTARCVRRAPAQFWASSAGTGHDAHE